MQPEVLRILRNISVLLQKGLYVGQECLALPEALQLVNNMIADGSPKEEAPDAEA